MVQNPFHDLRLFETGGHFDGTAVLFIGFDIDFEHAPSLKAAIEQSVP